MSLKIGVIGAGISSAVFSRAVSDVARVHVFEKSRGTGGRLSRHCARGFNFDIGCQDIVLPPSSVPNIIARAITEKALVPWSPLFRHHDAHSDTIDINLKDIGCFCGNENMNQFVKWAFDDTKIMFQEQISEVVKKNHLWFFISERGEQHGPFDIVVMSCPAPQIMTLTQTFNDELNSVTYDSCLVINVGLSNLLPLKTAAVIKSENTLSRWLIQSHLKPNSTSKPGLTIQSKPLDYAYLTLNKEQLVNEMIKESFAILDATPKIEYKNEHIWRYSKCTHSLKKPLLYKNQIGVIGDCLEANSNRSNIESCIDSAVNLAQHINTLI